MNTESVLNKAHALLPKLREHRRWLHSHAEIGFELHETVAYVRQALSQMGYQPKEMGKCGLVIEIGKKSGKTILLRADMDALPMQEETGLEFASTNGNMHACGHDMHTAMLLGAAALLKEQEDRIPGCIKLMFQPAEEILSGAKDMIDAGVLKKPSVDAAMMLHVAAGVPLPSGTVIVPEASVSAPAADYFTIRIQGKGCHGSAPHTGIDPIIPGAHIILALQNLRGREIAASNPCMLTVGRVHGGTSGNVIADWIELEGTIRSFDDDTQSYLKQRLTQISENTAEAFRATATVTFGSGCPTLINDPAFCDFSRKSLVNLLGKQQVLFAEELRGDGLRGGSEDFAYISHKVPTLMVALAAGGPEQGFTYGLHHPKVDFDEQVLSIGAAILADTAINWLKSS